MRLLPFYSFNLPFYASHDFRWNTPASFSTMKTTISFGCISGESVSHVSAAATTVSSTPMNLLDSCFSHLLLNYLSPFSNINNNNKVFFLLLKCPGFDFQIGFVSIKSLSGAVASVFRICWHGKTYLSRGGGGGPQ